MRFEILIDKKENPRKCTIHPLKDRSDFDISYFKSRPIPALKSDVFLHIDGEDLGEIRPKLKVSSLALLDCTWKKVAPTLALIAQPLPRLVKIPADFQTAYPRRNLEGKDPTGGLATIEALFIAAAFCGNWDESLLSKYHFKEQFLAINAALWEQYELKS